MKAAGNIWPRLLKTVFFAAFILFAPTLQAQYDNYWAWGPHRALDFGRRIPAPKYSKASYIPYYSSICDSAGRLLFYCDDDSVWDRNNNPLPNQCIRSYQPNGGSPVILRPKNRDEYYLFYSEINYGNTLGIDSLV